MSTETHRALLASIFDGLARGDGAAFWEALADDAVWTLMGDTAWSGAYRGKVAIYADLITPMRARLGVTRSLVQRIIVDGDWAAVQFRGDNQTVEGRRYDNHYVYIIRFEGGRIAEITDYMDTELTARVLGPRVP